MAKVENIQQVIEHLVPGAQYSVVDNDPDQLVWNDKRPKPTVAQIQAAIPIVQDIMEDEKKAERITKLEMSMHAYIDKYYSPQMRDFFITMCLEHLLSVADGKKSSCSKERLDALMEMWQWTRRVVEHFETLVSDIVKGKEQSIEDVDWGKLFDNTNPGYTISTLPE